MGRDIRGTSDNSFGYCLSNVANWVIKIIGCAIFALVAWDALMHTQYMLPDGDEIPLILEDSVFANLFYAGLAILVIAALFYVEKHLSKEIRIKIMRIAPIITMLWVGAWSFWWIFAVDRQPVGDQAHIYAAASYFMEGEYVFLSPGCYCGQHPYQLGLIALVELIFRIVGPLRYRVLQAISAGMAVLIVYFGSEIAWEISKKMTVVVTYCAFMIGCVPLVFYTGWVYGDIPSILFGMILAYCLLRYEKTGQVKWLAGIVCSAVFAMLVRENSMILLIALCLTGGVALVKRWDVKLFSAIILSVLLPFLAYQGIYKMYEVRSGIPHSDGFASISYITMGMQEAGGKCGWYTPYAGMVYHEQNSDTVLAAQASRLDLMDRLAEFRSDPAYAKQFYINKVKSQWNEPLYQSLFFSNQYFEGKEPAPGSFVSKISNIYFDKVLRLSDRLQFIIYLGMLAFFLFVVNQHSSMPGQLLAVTIIGGFLFSILWEAKARYILPYYIMMYPFAIKGYYQMIANAAALINRVKLGNAKQGPQEEEEGAADVDVA